MVRYIALLSASCVFFQTGTATRHATTQCGSIKKTGIATRLLHLAAYEEKGHEGAKLLTHAFFDALRGLQAAKNRISKQELSRAFEYTYEEAGWGKLSDNPFALCGVGWEDLTDLDSWRDDVQQGWVDDIDGAKQANTSPAVLQFLGKKKKGVEFWKTPLSEPAGFLVKSVHAAELKLLAGMRNTISEHYVGCSALQSSLLLPVLFTITTKKGKDYIVMRDETLRLTQVAGEHWNVVAKYDIKPLPNLSDDLLALISLFSNLVNEGFSPIMLAWDGWETVYGAIATAVSLLDASVAVDYSLFIHVLVPARQSDGGGYLAPRVEGLDATRGCITEPSGKMIACIKVIDYMTPYTALRSVESFGKGGKFYDYAAKFLHALECLGNIEVDDCDEYRAYARVKGKVSPSPGSDAKALAFVRTRLFQREYQCKVSRPQNFWLDTASMLKVSAPSETSSASVRMINIHPQYNNTVAQGLRAALFGTQDIGTLFPEQLWEAHDASIAMEKKLPEAKVQECVTGIQEFASYNGVLKQRRNKDLENVAWSSSLRSIFVVREKPFFSSNDVTVQAMSKNGCYMRTFLYRCQPMKKGSVQISYTLKFGSLEILEVQATRYSDEFPNWANSTEFLRLAERT